jgi:hypothetical protein
MNAGAQQLEVCVIFGSPHRGQELVVNQRLVWVNRLLVKEVVLAGGQVDGEIFSRWARFVNIYSTALKKKHHNRMHPTTSFSFSQHS